jgi:hypothetical protein
MADITRRGSIKAQRIWTGPGPKTDRPGRALSQSLTGSPKKSGELRFVFGFAFGSRKATCGKSIFAFGSAY